MLGSLMVLLPLMGCFFVLAVLLLMALRRERSELNDLMCYVISFLLIMTVSFTLELLYDSISTMMVWNFTFYVSFNGAMISMMLYGIRVLDLRPWTSAAYRQLILAIPLISISLLFLDPFTGLFYTSVEVAPFGPFTYLSTEPGLGFGLFVLFGSILVAFLAHFLVKEMLSAVRPSRDVLVLLTLIPASPILNLIVVRGLGEPIPSTYSLLVVLTLFSVAVMFLPEKMGARISSPTYKNLLQGLEVGVAVTDPDGHLLYLNAEAESHLGLREGGSLPQILLDLLDARLENDSRQDLALDLGSGTRHFDVRVEALRGGRGDCDGYLLVLDDITQRVLVQEDLMRTQEKLSILSGITRHDISNQLAVILGYGELLRDRQGLDESTWTRLNAIIRAADNIRLQTEFMNDYHNVGRAEPVWQSLRETFSRALSQTDLSSLSYTFEGEDVEILADPMLEKVFLNLVVNTLRHAEGAKGIRVSKEARGGSLLIAYEDDGVGIAAEEKELVFQREFGRGSGMGLFLSKAILEMTSLEIWEEGESGARFIIRVPPGAHRPA